MKTIGELIDLLIRVAGSNGASLVICTVVMAIFVCVRIARPTHFPIRINEPPDNHLGGMGSLPGYLKVLIRQRFEEPQLFVSVGPHTF